MSNFISFKNVSFSYYDEVGGKRCPVLKNVSVDIPSGQYVAILGHNGSGKSTFAKLINMILEPNEGKIFVDGIDITSSELTEDNMINLRKNVGMVFQNPDNQLVATIVEEDVAFGPENLGLAPEEIRKKVDWALQMVNMTAYAEHEPHRLSGGQKQRVAIAGVLAMMPKCIIFDESTSMLDPIGRREILEIMKKLNSEKGITIVNITHYMEEASEADRILVLNDGTMLLDGTPEEIFSKKEILYSIGLEVPQCACVFQNLQEKGFDLSGECSTVDKTASSIYNLWLKLQEKRNDI